MPKVVVTDKKGLIQETGTGFTFDNNDADKPAYFALTAANGTTVRYLFINNAGTLKIHTAVPTSDGDGTAV